MTESRSARLAGYAFVIATIAVHGAIAWLSPIQSDDWEHWLWAKTHEHDSTGEYALAFLSSHATFSDVIGFILARSTLFHAIVTPIVSLAVVGGMFTLATRRRPRLDALGDVFGLVALSALLWIAAPRVGLTWFHRPYVALWVYGTAAALWTLAPFRCGWQPRGAWVPLLFVGGLCAGSSTRQIGTTALIVTIVAIRRTPERARWMWSCLAGLALGTILVHLDLPRVDFRGFKPGFEASLGALNLTIREGGELVSLVLGLVMVKIVLSRLRPEWSGVATPPDTSESLRWLGVWFGFSVLALFGPRYTEAMLFPAMIVLCMGALPYVVWLATARALRPLLVALVSGVHVIAWTISLATYVEVGAEFRDRIARLEGGGERVVVSPYRRIEPTFWFFGEDWVEATTRQLIGITLFDVSDIMLSPGFRRLESNPQIAIRIELTGVTNDQLLAIRIPRTWATNPNAARRQFEPVARELARFGGDVSARLVVDGFALPVLRGRPLLAASYERGQLTTMKVTRKPLDDDNRHSLLARPASFVTEHREAYGVSGERVWPITYEQGGYRLQPLTTELHAVVACDPRACYLVDAFVPRL